MAEARGNARLFVLSGPDLARSFPLAERTTIGRSDECDVVLRDRSISRKHALIARQEERWFVQDLGSTNGVTKGGQRGERFELADGDEFRLGDLPLRFRLQAQAGAQDIEFDLSASAQTILSRVPDAEPAAAAPVEPVLEGADEIEIESPDAPLPAAPPGLRPAPPTPRAARHTGLFSGDFEQHPFWMRCLLVAGLIAVGAGVAYGAFLAVQMLREGT